MKTIKTEQSKVVELSIVTTMYRSEEFISEFYRLSTEAALKHTSSYEIVFVNDGSPDNSIHKAQALVEKDSHVRVIDLSKNFGHHRAIMVGLEYSKGQKVFLIDCDLEEDPLLLSEFFIKMTSEQADVVYGVQKIRKGGVMKSVAGGWFWSLFNLISEVKLTPNQITSRLMSKRYIDALLVFREKELFLAGIFALAGFKQTPMLVNKGVRADTSYTLRKRFALVINAITSFSSRPLHFVFNLGLTISVFAIIAALVLLVQKLFFTEFDIGWASVIVSIWLTGGVIIFCLGIIGVYLAKIFQEVKDRPLSIIRNIYEKNEDQV